MPARGRGGAGPLRCLRAYGEMLLCQIRWRNIAELMWCDDMWQGDEGKVSVDTMVRWWIRKCRVHIDVCVWGGGGGGVFFCVEEWSQAQASRCRG